MMNQSSSNEKQTNMWYQIASSASNQRTKFVRFTLQTRDFAPLTRWHCELQKGIIWQLIPKGEDLPIRDFRKQKIFLNRMTKDLYKKSIKSEAMNL